MKNKNTNPAVVVAATLDRIAIPVLGMIDAMRNALDEETKLVLSPGYREAELELAEKLKGMGDDEVSDRVNAFIDRHSVLIWSLAGPAFLKFAGHSDEEIARVCDCLGFGGVGDKTKTYLTEG